MPYIHDDAYDALLDHIRNNTEEIHICTVEPATVTEAISTYSLGQKVSPTINAPSDKAGGGRELVVPSITDGSCDAPGDAAYWACVKTSATSKLLATGVLTNPQTVSTGNPFTLTTFPIGVPDAVAQE